MITLLLVYIIVGIAGGMLSGSLGLGGGIIIVPALTFLFERQDFSSDIIERMATGSSLAVISITTGFSVWTHHRQETIAWSHSRAFIPGMMLGAVLGVWLGQYFSPPVLRYAFAVFCVALAVKIGVYSDRSEGIVLPAFFEDRLFWIALGTGVIGGLLGIGGGVIIIPLLIGMGLSMAVIGGTSSACAFPTAMAGALFAIIVGYHAVSLPLYSTGYIYWPAVLVIGMGSLLGVPLGVYCSRRLPEKTMRKIFSLILVLIAWKMA